MGQIHRIRGNQSLFLNGFQSIWVVKSGTIALFAVFCLDRPDLSARGARRYLFDCRVGEAIFASAVLQDAPFELLAVSLEEVELWELERPELEAQLQAGDPLAGQYLTGWLNHLTTIADLPRVSSPPTLVLLDQTYEKFLRYLTEQQLRQQAENQLRWQDRDSFEQQLGLEAINNLAAILRSTPVALPAVPTSGSEPSAYFPLYQAMRAIGQELGVTVQLPRPAAFHRTKLPLAAIARTARLRFRRVLLSDDWWQRDCGPLLAYTQQDNQPVALLPDPTGRYRVFNPDQKTLTPLTPELNHQLSPVAYCFYRPLPEQPLSRWDLLRFSLRGTNSDWWTVCWTGIATVLVGMLLPQATAILIDQAIPAGNRQLLAEIASGLLAIILGSSLFQLVQGFALVRLETKIEATAQAALWDRLLTLDVPFFREFATGDLRSRVAVINTIRRQVSGASLRLLLNSSFALLNLLLLGVYSLPLAGIALAFLLIELAISALICRLILLQALPLQELEGAILGLMVQLINGVSKLRVAGAEGRAFAFWSQQYSRQQQLKFRLQRTQDWLTIVNQGFPVLVTALLFGLVMLLLQAGTQLTLGQFLAFNLAFGSFIAGTTSFCNTLMEVLSAIALSQRADPILRAKPEGQMDKTDPGELSGRVALDQVVFRYRSDTLPVLDRVTLRVEPGEFVAIVGASGSGKSTLFRLLLGFETPQVGQVTYDGQDLRNLNIHAVRRQLGVLLQTTRATTASIFDNIAGSLPITMDDAWEAARQAGLAEEIAAMPMGMHTMVSEGGSNLSGGQRQRLLIARALALKPRLLLFDEATSFLDNRTQAIVSESLDHLQITRIVIAHRLSTIKNADRIYVLSQGRITQQGNFEELMRQEGLFRQLMQRQIG